MSFIDQEFEPLAADKSGPIHGLVVGPRLTEKQFEAMAVELNAMAKAGTLPVVEFENELGELETRAPGRGTDL
jgi:hypothetical protein